MEFIDSLESSLGMSAIKNFMPMQAGDVYQTYAEVEDLFAVTGHKPAISVSQGVENFVQWYRKFYNIAK